MHGPNGTHSVWVTDVVAPILSLLSPICPPPLLLWHKAAAAYGLMQAVVHLHTLVIVHGSALSSLTINTLPDAPLDLHLGNLGLAIPELTNQDPDDIMHELTIALPTSPADQMPSLPVYIVTPCTLATYYNSIACSDLPQMKIYDFGMLEFDSPLLASKSCDLSCD